MTQKAEILKREITKLVTMDYLLFLPQEYEDKAEEKWPLILFLHGAGERGEDIEMVKKHGIPKKVEQDPSFPFIVISPQCPAHSTWAFEMDALMGLLDEIQEKYRVDSRRIYLTGLSMGGYETWHISILHPERFAAIAPICGGGIPEMAGRIREIPAWVFHGAKDQVVPIQESEAMVEALKACGGDVRFTVYPEADHDSWTETYANPELYEWFLSHEK